MATEEIELSTGSANQGVRYTVSRNAGASKFAGKEVYTARVVADTAALGEVADAMVAHGCPYAKSYIVAVLTDMANVMGDLLRQGRAVNLGGLVTLRPSIKGTFEGEDGSFTSGTNRLTVSASVGVKLRGVTSGVATIKQGGVTLPSLERIVSVVDGSENTLCSEGQFIVVGNHLTWDDEQPDEGFFLVLQGVKTKCTVIVPDTKGKRPVLRTSQAITPGDEPEVWFYTRVNGGLFQVRYEAQLTCVAPPEEP